MAAGCKKDKQQISRRAANIVCQHRVRLQRARARIRKSREKYEIDGKSDGFLRSWAETAGAECNAVVSFLCLSGNGVVRACSPRLPTGRLAVNEPGAI